MQHITQTDKDMAKNHRACFKLKTATNNILKEERK